MKDLDSFLGSRDLPSVVALGTSREDTLYEGAFGKTNQASGHQVNMDTPFAIMSMTKPVTSIAIMRLIEAGEVELKMPGAHYLPAYRDLPVLTDVDRDKKSYRTTPATRPFTIHDLLTHTSGIGYTFCNETLQALRPESDALPFPLCHEPGERWTYGASTRLLGEIIASVSGQSLAAALKSLVLDPLGMNDTSYEPREDQAQTHVMVDGKWQANELARQPMEVGDGGLISTARDYAKFVRCLLRDGAPLLSLETFRQVVTNQIGDLFVTEQPATNPNLTHPFPAGAGVDKWGFGFQIHMGPAAGMRSPGSISWCGLYNTYFWADPVKQIGGILLMQILPLYTPACRETLAGFEQRLYAALK